MNSLFLQECPVYPFVLLGWFVRWEISSRKANDLKGAASGICSKQNVAFLCSFHIAFSPSVSLKSWLCIHIVVPIWLPVQ